mmetsp:Transcript_15816/g.45461  ORF Transcript_15816/g.45461 Transcript_15816/m.45461 type:complete len:247 (-) Transcript_15816:937-1677(-)
MRSPARSGRWSGGWSISLGRGACVRAGRVVYGRDEVTIMGLGGTMMYLIRTPPLAARLFLPNERDFGPSFSARAGRPCAHAAARRGGPRADGPSRGARPVGVALTRRARPPASFSARPSTVADRGRRSRCFSAPGSQRAPAALSRRVTAADIMCSVVPAGAELRHVELFGNSTAGAPAGSPLAPPLRTKPAHAARTQLSARHHPRAGTSRRVGALVRLNADLLPLPLSAMRPLRQCTPRTRRQIPL